MDNSAMLINELVLLARCQLYYGVHVIRYGIHIIMVIIYRNVMVSYKWLLMVVLLRSIFVTATELHINKAGNELTRNSI